jgi:hypothetical protein
MPYVLNWNANVTEGGGTWTGTASGDSVTRSLTEVAANAEVTIALQPQPSPAVQALLISATRYDGVLFGAGTSGVVADVELPGTAFLTLEASLLFGIPAPTHLKVKNTNAEPLTVEVCLLRDA